MAPGERRRKPRQAPDAPAPRAPARFGAAQKRQPAIIGDPPGVLFTKSLRRDLANIAGIVFAALFTIMATTSLIRLLGRAAVGRVDTDSVLPLIAFASIQYLPVVLTLTLYVAVLMVLSRAYRDSEMVIWFASGQSVLAFVRPVLRFALPFVVLVGALSLLVTPWANLQTIEYRERFAQRTDVSQVAAGQFRESVSAQRVFFVEALSEDQTSVRNVFVTQGSGDTLLVVVSAGGRIEQESDGDRFIVLERGRRYDREKDGAEFRVMEFERYGLRLDQRPVTVQDGSSKVRSTLELALDPTSRNLGELLWRIGQPVSALLLALLAIPLSAFNPRVGRSANLFGALLLFLLYNNLLSLMQAWVASGRLSFAVAVWIVHAGVALLLVWLLWRRLTLRRPWLGRWRLRRAGPPPAPAG